MKKVRQPGDLTVHVKGKNLTVTQGQHDQVVRKMQRLDRYLDRLQQVDVELSTDKTRDADHQCCVEVTTHVVGRTIRVRTVAAEMHAAVDEAVDKLYRQLNRTKERTKAHHGARLADYLPEATDEGDAEDGNERIPAIVPEMLSLEPQFEEEAAEELEDSSRDFLVFLNAQSERINVLYRREDGNFGLIEPRAR